MRALQTWLRPAFRFEFTLVSRYTDAMGKLDEIRRMREAKHERDTKRANRVRTDKDAAPATRLSAGSAQDSGGSSGPNREQRTKVGKDMGASNAARVRTESAFDRATYQREYMKNTYRPRIKAKREAEAEELARLRELLKPSGD